jgi:transcriptional regulator with XRE-family HTH domain
MATISWRARALKAALRSALEHSGISAREVARQLDVSHMKVNRWLADDSTAPNAEDTASFLACITVTGDERDRLLSMARAEDADWMVSGPTGINPQLASVLECERYAVRITEWQPLVWPGLLQSRDYARAVFSRGGDLTPQELEMRVMMRIARRDALTRRRKPVQFTALIGLPAVHGRIGGPEVMADQLSHVQGVTRQDNVTIQVVDLNTDWTPAHAGGFILYEFDDELPAAVYLEHFRSWAVLVDEADVADYKTAVEIIRREAMSPEQSAGLIADVIPTMETTE